jgi:hypothetical protein
MTITLSDRVMDAMGFREAVAEGALVASFMSVTVYEVRGIVVPKDFAHAVLARVAGAEYRVAIAESVNAGCRALTGDDFVEAEPTWREEVKSKGPFALIAVGPTEFVECAAGRLARHDGGSVTTYDAFPRLRGSLHALERRVIPRVLAALTCALNEPERYVALRKLTRVSVGRCPDGTQVQDLRLEISASMYASRALDGPTLTSKLAAATTHAPSLNREAARFFSLGAGEDDQLKRFLYFFLALEIETHAVFGRVDHRRHTVSLLSGVGKPSPATVDLLMTQVESLANLFDRFVWCATCVWTNLTEEDVALFKALKDARDSIAHGRASEPPAGFARSAELLAHRVLWR